MEGLVFIHGIRSTCATTFGPIVAKFLGAQDERFRGWAIESFDYDWRDAITINAARFSKYIRELNERIGSDGLCVIAHSMGGLVARRAIIDGADGSVKRLIMLGTPNFGAISTAQLGLLSQPAMYATTSFIGQYLRADGVRDLTRIPQLFRDAHKRTVETVYATIPGTFFHENRPFWDATNFGSANALFGSIVIATELMQALKPIFRVNLQRPHDGIVEDRSCSLFPSYAGRRTEKDASLNGGALSKTYAHILPPASDELTHSELARDNEVCAVMKEIILSQSLPIWRASAVAMPVKW